MGIGPLELLIVLFLLGIIGVPIVVLIYVVSRHITIKRVCPKCGYVMRKLISYCPTCNNNLEL